ncbi:hypothetical protein CHLNCDRAFT_144252 [Chlorella variabilis]|uniref:Uncharacterized protein n=1 Tax=Chlorella variabilis TaxID=554065 RepID=E1ZC97_CHLVA|nr:hypothetical protein CHLNCDRAFT_144252 [Chlorella variabilis]EFN56573.1 hypothetical protein CHLNCDRAFT_144252 [Chlorella variabilis]|eukprot:XP_005848675.1 hypothetical protein CHLNCDRAFT_144252 [Chlorella variabilis]
MPPCCGVCIFARRRCTDFYPRQALSDTVARDLLDTGFPLQDFTPCELFQRIRGRTLWFMGDSQMLQFYYAAECFLREFAPSLRRTPAVPFPDNHELMTVRAPVPYPPICLDLALGTRVCAVRVDAVRDLIDTVIPKIQALVPNCHNDGIVVLNFGLHYPKPGSGGRPVEQSLLHFKSPDGSWPGGPKPFTCARLDAWMEGDPAVLAGGAYNAAIVHLLPAIADAHLKTWNATAPLWRTHWPDECSHWCHPSAYQLWLFLLNAVLQRRPLGSKVVVRGGADLSRRLAASPPAAKQ